MKEELVFIKELKKYIKILPKQSIKVLRGQALSRNIIGGRKGLNKILNRKSR